MTEIDLIVLAFTLVGFLPMQALRSRRAAIIAGAIALLAILASLGLFYAKATTRNDVIAMGNALMVGGCCRWVVARSAAQSAAVSRSRCQ